MKNFEQRVEPSRVHDSGNSGSYNDGALSRSFCQVHRKAVSYNFGSSCSKSSSDGTDCTTCQLRRYLLIVIRILPEPLSARNRKALSPAESATSRNCTELAQSSESLVHAV
jgi:hypothetical protein